MKKFALMMFVALGCGDAFCMDQEAFFKVYEEEAKYLEDSESTSIPEYDSLRERIKGFFGCGPRTWGRIGDPIALRKCLTTNPDASDGISDDGLNALVGSVANRLPCVKVYLELGADPNLVSYTSIRAWCVNRSQKIIGEYIRLLSSYGMDPMTRQWMQRGLNLFQQIEEDSLTPAVLRDQYQVSFDIPITVFDEETKASLKRVIVRARDAYFSARKDEFEPRIRHHSDRLSRLLNGRTLQPSELPTSLPNELIYKIVWHAWESHPKMAVLNEQITQWEADKATHGLDSVAGQEHRRKRMNLDRATSEITAVAAQD